METADEFRANSHLKSAEYSIPVLGLIFLKFADSRFTQAEAEPAGENTSRREIGKVRAIDDRVRALDSAASRAAHIEGRARPTGG